MTTIDCDTCPVRGRHCGDCFVPVLARSWVQDLPEPVHRQPAEQPLPLDGTETAAVAAFVRAGLVGPGAATGLRAARTGTAWSAVG